MAKKGAPLGNKNASKGYGSASQATKAFGVKRGFFGLDPKHEARIDNYLGHSMNKKIINNRIMYKIATKDSIKKGKW